MLNSFSSLLVLVMNRLLIFNSSSLLLVYGHHSLIQNDTCTSFLSLLESFVDRESSLLVSKARRAKRTDGKSFCCVSSRDKSQSILKTTFVQTFEQFLQFLLHEHMKTLQDYFCCFSFSFLLTLFFHESRLSCILFIDSVRDLEYFTWMSSMTFYVVLFCSKFGSDEDPLTMIFKVEEDLGKNVGGEERIVSYTSSKRYMLLKEIASDESCLSNVIPFVRRKSWRELDFFIMRREGMRGRG